jgi:outer membrane protein insertion porin family
MIYNRLRGYDDYSVIPEGNSYREGGRSMVILTSEYKFPVVENQVFLLGFVEAGNTWNSLGETDLSDLKRSAGFGIRVITPLGPLGFDYAYGFDRGAEGKWEPHFVFGSFF